jgi:DNA polymerase-3 subunit alpha
MGKKIPEEMAKERPKFIEGATANGVSREKAGEVFDLLEKFANYGFNKSHAAAYAVVSYQTAWLKANHPVEFMAAVMNCDIHLTDKLSEYAEEVRKRLQIRIVPPCVNRSGATFTVRDGAIHYALGALKNVGVEAMRLIVAARGDTPFATLFDVARRVDLKRIGKRPMEMLARAGAFDMLDPNRARVFEALDALVAYSAAVHESRASTQGALFGDGGSDIPEPRLPFRSDWLPVERLAQEQAAVGFYLSGHPLDDYMSALKRRDVKTLAEVQRLTQSGPAVVKLAGAVAGRQERKSARGNRFAFAQLSDPTGGYEITVFSDVLETARELLEPGKNVVVTAEATLEGETLKLLARSAAAVEAMAEAAPPAGLRVHLADGGVAAEVAALFARIAGMGARGRAPVHLCIPDARGREIDLALPGEWPEGGAVKGALKQIAGVRLVEDL